MRREDLDELQKPYSEGTSETEDTRLCSRLGLCLPNVELLRRRVFDDLNPNVFGVGWWEPHLPTRQRILLADYLYSVVSGVTTNLIEAKLHLLEALDAWEALDRWYSNSIARDAVSAQISVKLPRRNSPRDALLEPMAVLHVVGFFRAINSALDCLGGSIVGVGAVPCPIVMVGLKTARSQLTAFAKSKTPTGKGRQLLQDLEQSIGSAETAAGPAGWLSWTSSFRNMVVHRGRRIGYFMLQPKQPLLLDGSGELVLRADSIPILPVEPRWTDVDALRGSRPQFLSEPAQVTLQGALQSTASFVERVAIALAGIWDQRRREPGVLPQPNEQWPNASLQPSAGFDGFRPGSTNPTFTQITANPSEVARFRAAALDDAHRHVWV
jgi:hypothetical protein